MRLTRELGMAIMAIMALTASSCVTLHRHRHRHHPHRHRVVVVAEQTTATEQNKDGITFDECLAMTEPDAYGSTE